MISYVFLLLIGIILGVIAQLGLKKGVDQAGLHVQNQKFSLLLRKLIFNPFIFLGFLCYALSLLFWLVILSRLELSYAYPMISSGYFFVTLASMLFFKEKVSWQRWTAIGIIIFGVVLVGLS